MTEHYLCRTVSGPARKNPRWLRDFRRRPCVHHRNPDSRFAL